MNYIAILKNGKVYLRDKSKHPQVFPPEESFNFDIAQLKSFDPMWAVFPKMPTTAYRCIKPIKNISGYVLKDGYEPTKKTPQTLPLDSFIYLGEEEYLNDDIRGLYDPQYKITKAHYESVEITIDIIDQDCEPLTNPKYTFIADFPYYIENHDSVLHKYPCKILYKLVFQHIRNACKANLPSHCKITSDFDSHFAVELNANVIHEELHEVDINSISARKPRYVNKPLRNVPIKIIDIETKNDYNNSTQIQTLHAPNYESLESAMDALIQSYIKKMQWKPTVCPHCKGYGIIEHTPP